MKNMRTVIENEVERLDQKWRDLPLQVQCRYIVIIFICYFVICLGMLGTVWYQLGKENPEMAISHIESPAIGKRESVKKDSLWINSKNNSNGRERE